MRKLFYTLGTIAAVAFALTSCERQEISNPDDNLVTITLKADKAGVNTKTSAVEGDEIVSYEWTAEDVDNMKLFIVGVGSDGKETLSEVESTVINISSDNKILAISATVPANSVLRAALSSAWTSSNNPKVNVNQRPHVNNFDPNADILVSDEVTVSGVMTDKLLTFRRPVAVSKMTLKNLVAGEKVYEIALSSDTHLTGNYYSGSMTGQERTLTLYYDNEVVGENGEFPVYFVTMPNDGHTLTVVVKTDQHNYKKTFGTLDFAVGKFAKFSVNLPDGTEVEDNDFSGDWVIAGVNGSNVYAAQAYVSGNNLSALVINLDAENEKIVSAKVDEIKMHFEKVTEGDYAGSYTIKDDSGNYLYAASSSANQLKGNTTLGSGAEYYWSVEESDGVYSIKSKSATNRGVMQFNSGSSLFSCYASASEKPVTLYPFSWVTADTTVEVPKGDGSFDSPFNPLAAVEYVSSLSADVESTEDFYISGIISSITSTFSTRYGNATFYISEDGSATTTQFQAYRVLYLGNREWVSGDTQIAVGDEVVIYGKVVNYKGSTPETVQNKAYLYSLNGVTEKDPELVSIAITTAPSSTTFTVGDTFVFNGTVTATYDDGSTKDVTASVTTDGATVIASAGENKTVTVYYTENDITKTATYTVTVFEAGETIQFSWERNGTTDVVSDGYTFTPTIAQSKSGYYQDKSSTEGLDVTLRKDDGAIFSSTPVSISLTATVGGGSKRDPLNNNVYAYLVDNEGSIIDGTETVVTTKVEASSGDAYTVSLPLIETAYGIRIVHEKEGGYNVRLYNVSVTIR